MTPQNAPDGEAGEPVTRRALTLSGWVQGVGLRWRAQTAANALGATGWVRNNFDGSVSMELQGREADIDALLISVERGTYVRIEALTAKTVPVVENERVFSVLDDGEGYVGC